MQAPFGSPVDDDILRSPHRRGTQQIEGVPATPASRRRRASMIDFKKTHPWHCSNSFEKWEEPEPSFQVFIRTHSAASSSRSFEPLTVNRQIETKPISNIGTFEESVVCILRLRKTNSGLDIRQLKSFESTTSSYKLDPHETAIKDVIAVRPKTPFEEVDSYHDRLYILDTRKAIMRIWAATRQFCFKLTSHPAFTTFILLMILWNTILLALEDPALNVQPEPYFSMEETLLYIYTTELGLKVVALGFVIGQGAYIRDPWNVLDFIVVISGWIELEYTSSGINLSALRALRILRPLRSITRIQGMRIVFMSLMGSAKTLLSTIVLLLFFYTIISIAALQMFMGVLRYRCMDLDTGVVNYDASDSGVCGNLSCPNGYLCVKGLANPNYGKSNFDNVMLSAVTLFQCITMEGWTNVMNNAEKSFNVLVVIFFVPVVLLGSFFFMNLTTISMSSSVNSYIVRDYYGTNQRQFGEKERNRVRE